MQNEGFKLDEANMIYDPNNPLDLENKETLQVMDFIEKVEDVDDVQNVYSALDIDDEDIAMMEGA